MRHLVLVVILAGIAGCSDARPGPAEAPNPQAEGPSAMHFAVVPMGEDEALYESEAGRRGTWSGDWTTVNIKEVRPAGALTYFVNESLPCPLNLVFVAEHGDKELQRTSGDHAIVARVPVDELGEYAYWIDFEIGTGACRVHVDIQYEAFFEPGDLEPS